MKAVTDAYERDDDGYIDDPDFTGTRGRIIDHYRRTRPVYEALGTVGSYSTTGFIGNFNWYIYDGNWRRAKTFGEDFDDILDDAEPGVRSMYAVTSWKETDAIMAGATRSGKSFESGEGLAGYDDVRACSVWVDCDLTDKKRRGAFGDGERKGIEMDIEGILAVVADMYGMEPEDIAAFDSGGGIYPWGPAGATVPIVEAFGADEADGILLDGEPYDTTVGYIFDELTDRIKDHLDASINIDYISLDAATNKNRQSKAPLSIHGNHDILVTPLRDDEGNVDYTPTLVSEMDDELLRRSVAEVNKITTVTDETRAAVGPLVETLWPEFDGDWDQRLAQWILDEREQALDTIHSRALTAKHRRDRDRNREQSDGEQKRIHPTTRDSDITPHRQDVYDDLDRLDIKTVCDETVVHRWSDRASGVEDTSGAGKRAFIPTWRTDSNGSACYVNSDGAFTDTKHMTYGTAVEAALIADGSWTAPQDGCATGHEWAEGVEYLRERGYPVRRWIPECGSDYAHGTYERTPEWAMREMAYSEGHDPADDCWRDVNTGRAVAQTADEATQYTDDTGIDTQRSLPALAFNAVLDLLDDEGYDHQRDRRSIARD